MKEGISYSIKIRERVDQLSKFRLKSSFVGFGIVCIWNKIISGNLHNTLVIRYVYLEMSQRMTKPTKWHVRPAKAQISLGIHPF